MTLEQINAHIGQILQYEKLNGEHRVFTLIEAQKLAVAKSTGKEYIRATLLDHDDGNIEVERTLHTERISWK